MNQDKVQKIYNISLFLLMVKKTVSNIEYIDR